MRGKFIGITTRQVDPTDSMNSQWRCTDGEQTLIVLDTGAYVIDPTCVFEVNGDIEDRRGPFALQAGDTVDVSGVPAVKVTATGARYASTGDLRSASSDGGVGSGGEGFGRDADRVEDTL